MAIFRSIAQQTMKVLAKIQAPTTLSKMSTDVLPDNLKQGPSKSKNMVLPLHDQTFDNQIIPLGNMQSLYQHTLQKLNAIYHHFYTEPSTISSQMDILTRNNYDVKKIVIIGVNGWFPSKIFSRVIGEPIGTSGYISSKMQIAIIHYFNVRLGVILDKHDIEIINLEGQGKVEDRVESHYQQLIDPKTNHSTKITDADLIIIVAHSQGSPVSAILLSRLISEKIINPKSQQTGILALAGIHHGPYPQLKTSMIIKYVESDPAKQLFDFNLPYSPISRAFYDAMTNILQSGCKFTAVGSWYDQVVPLYSATLQGLEHPNIYRALYIDQQDYLPDFLSHLVVFALKLRNHGLSDYNLIVYLSDVLAGNIYGFGTQGHSAIYEETNSYLIGISWILGDQIWKSSRLGSVISHPPFTAPQKINPFYLPWIMSQLVHDEHIKNNEELRLEFEEVLKLFVAWMPSAGHLKDLKYRLEALKTKL